jgi:MFS family permease
VYFVFQYILGAGFGTIVTGALSDMFARNAMTAAAVSEMTAEFRAAGLHSAILSVVPLAMLLTALFLLFAASAFGADRDKVAAAESRVEAALA